MPLYDYECPKCEGKSEVYLCLKDAENTPVICSNCLEDMKRIISTSSKPIIYNYECVGIGEHITGPAQRARLMKEKGLSDAPRIG